MSSFNLQSKWATIKAHFPPHYGWAAVLAAAALLVVACGFVTIGIMESRSGNPVRMTLLGGELRTNPTKQEQNNEARKNEDQRTFEDRIKEALPPAESTTSNRSRPPTKEPESQQPQENDTKQQSGETKIPNVELDYSARQKLGKRKTPQGAKAAARLAKRSWGFYNLEIAAQGDLNTDDVSRVMRSYVRKGVRFYLVRRKCDTKRRVEPEVCYYAPGVHRPTVKLVQGW
jgi:hypothetical protein